MQVLVDPPPDVLANLATPDSFRHRSRLDPPGVSTG
jgi:hypothetical protein